MQPNSCRRSWLGACPGAIKLAEGAKVAASRVGEKHTVLCAVFAAPERARAERGEDGSPGTRQELCSLANELFPNWRSRAAFQRCCPVLSGSLSPSWLIPS